MGSIWYLWGVALLLRMKRTPDDGAMFRNSMGATGGAAKGALACRDAAAATSQTHRAEAHTACSHAGGLRNLELSGSKSTRNGGIVGPRHRSKLASQEPGPGRQGGHPSE